MQRYKEKPPGVSCRGVSWRLVRRSGSEVALNASVNRRRALVVERPRLQRLRRTGRERGEPGEVLVQHGVERFSRERQVLDGGPAGNHTHHPDAEVRVAAVGRNSSNARLARMVESE